MNYLIKNFLTIFVHASLETLLQSASLALVPMDLVNKAAASSILTPVLWSKM